MHIGIRNMETGSDRCRCFHKVTISENNEHIGSISCSSAFIDEFKGVADVIATFRVRAFPTTLFEDKNKFIIIL